MSNLILDSSFPANWFSLYKIQNLRIKFGICDWKLEWNRREQNILVDLTAKYALANNCLLSCDKFSTNVLPINISDRLISEQVGSGL